jgi:hypothetical protein
MEAPLAPVEATTRSRAVAPAVGAPAVHMNWP